MNKYLVVCFFSAIALFQSAPVAAQIKAISFGSELMRGDSTYQIGGNCSPALACSGFDGYFPLSELEFPMDMLLVTARAQGTFYDLNFDFQVKKSVISTEAKFKDSDWLTNSNPSQLDIYSESDSTVDALIIDASLDMEFKSFINNMNNYFGLGYIQQNIYFEARDTVQVYPSNPSRPAVYVNGLAITYQVDYSIAYLFYRAKYNINSDTTFNLKLGYSPSVGITDLDNHVVRNRTSRARLNGTAKIADLSVDIKFNKQTKLNFSYRLMNVRANGSQIQYQNGFQSAIIDEKISSIQKSLAVRYYYQF